ADATRAEGEPPCGGVVSDAPPAPTERPARKPRADSKQARLIAMLRGEAGATIAEIAAALEWEPHTVRGAIAGALKKKLGLDVTSEKVGERGRVYHLRAEG
ncbi:MAG TPA: DUF3489 domain-containing protein, partial [Kaistia sp.]|nr:DUF3489 domain-containing protein [Kaistia sp.]